MAVRVEGTGPPLVLLHGQPGSSDDWDRVVRRLAADHTVIVPDRPGYGDNPRPASGFAVNADYVASVLDDLGLRSATLVGHSWGAGAALAAAGRHPDRVDGLVLIAPIVPGAAVDLADRLLAAPLLGAFLCASWVVAARLLPLVPGAARAWRRVEPGLERGHARSAAQRLSLRRTWRSVLVEQRAFVGELPAYGSALVDVAARGVPTQVVVGVDDRIDAGAADRFATAHPGANLDRVRGGHLLPLERPDAVADAVRRATTGS